MPDQAQIRNKLMARKQKVIQRISDIDQDIRHEGMTSDWTEQATERENDEVLDSLGNTAQQELAMIKVALKRIDAGEYFHCISCGNQIPPARLELLPFSSFCVKCADELESQR